MILNYFFIFFIDVLGSIAMIFLSAFCLKLVREISCFDRENVIWTYLVWLCSGLFLFTLSRGLGHLLKQFLLLYSCDEIWALIQPYSGSVNTLTMFFLASISLFFHQIWKIYKQMFKDKEALQEAHGQLFTLNEKLKVRVKEGKRDLADESDRRMALEKRILQSEKMAALGKFAAGIAHEINNPLSVILAYCQLLIRNEDKFLSRDSYQNTEEDGPTVRQDLEVIEKHVKFSQNILKDLLAFSRNSELEKNFYDIHEIIDDLSIFIKEHGDSKFIRVNKNYDKDMPPLFINRERIRQVFINLLINASYAVGEDGVIDISTHFDALKKRAEILISDNGTGIGEDDISKVFEPFFTTKPTGRGTGLGLFLSYGIIKEHGGEIFVNSKKACGSSFTILLPS